MIFFEKLSVLLYLKEGTTSHPDPLFNGLYAPLVPLVGNRNRRSEGGNRPPVLGTATL